jgi:hypothetical protein
MTSRWDLADLEAVGGAAEVAVSPRRADGTLRPAGAVERNVSFDEPTDDISERVDDAYRARYGDSSYVDAMLAPHAQTTTLRLVPLAA